MTKSHPISDSDIIRRSLVTPSVFTEIFDRHHQAVYGYAVRRLGTVVGAHVLERTFLTSFAARYRFDGYGDACSWLLGCATACMRRYRRREARAWRGILAAPLPDFPGNVTCCHHPQGDQPALRIARAVGSLAQRDRDVLLLQVWGGLNHLETARALNMPFASVCARMNRSREAVAAVSCSHGFPGTDHRTAGLHILRLIRGTVPPLAPDLYNATRSTLLESTVHTGFVRSRALGRLPFRDIISLIRGIRLDKGRGGDAA